MKLIVSKKDIGFFAIWRHDQFPFFKGGTIREVISENLIETNEHGLGYWFTPIKILPINEGFAFLTTAQKIAEEKEKMQNRIYQSFKKDLDDLKKQHGIE